MRTTNELNKRTVGADASVRPSTKAGQNEGITLIALVITIIVMLILVAVTISMAINGGLFNYAKKATGEMQNAINEEQALADGKIKIGDVWYNSIDEYLKPEGNEEGTTLVSLYKSGDLKIGDYVDYNPKGATSVNPDNPENADGVTAGTLTGYTTAEQSVAYEKLSWRVLGYDETKNELLLISAAPTTGGLYFYGHVGYNNYENVLETICSKLYSNSSIGATARSITMTDIDTYLGGSAFNKETYGGGAETSGGYGYRNEEETSRFQINAETGDLELVANEGTVTLDLISTAYFYTASSVITDATKLDLLQGSNTSSPYYYWVASRAVWVYPGGAYWWLDRVVGGDVNQYNGICRSSGVETGSGLCVRPVVSLPSSVTTEQVPVLETVSTITWNDPLGWYAASEEK